MTTYLKQPSSTPFASDRASGDLVAGIRRLRLLLGLTLTLFALGAILSASAWASGAPENTERPLIFQTSPKLGTIEGATKGTWTNSPTSYAYQWRRCNASGGECVDIAGATSKSSYEVSEADIGHTLVFKVTASNGAGEGVAVSLPTAVVPKPVRPELVPAPSETIPLSFTVTGTAHFERANRSVWSCKVSLAGHFVSPVEAKQVKGTFSSCTSQLGPYTTENLKARLGYISPSSHTVALELTPEVGSVFLKNFLIGGPLEGSVFGQIAPVNTKLRRFQLTYIESEGNQSIQGFEGATGQHLSWGGERVGLGSEAFSPLTIETAQEVEIKG